MGQDNRQVFWSPGSNDVVEPGQALMQDVAVENQQRAQRLVLARCVHLPFDSERAEKLRDLGPAHLGRMPLAVKQDEATDPSDIGLLGAPTAVAQPIGLAHAIQQSGLAHASIDLERHSW